MVSTQPRPSSAVSQRAAGSVRLAVAQAAVAGAVGAALEGNNVLMSPVPQNVYSPELESAVVLRVEEHRCHVQSAGAVVVAEYAPQIPSPRVERIAPGHRVALASASGGRRVVVWRWFDAVVIGSEAEFVRLWEPAHGEVLASSRGMADGFVPGSRAYLSAGLPGADWWVSGPANASDHADVELDEVAKLYTQNGLWEGALAPMATRLSS
jgi:hypothetical protein